MYSIEPGTQAYLALEVYKTGVMSGKVHRFEFANYEGTLTLDPDSPDRSKVELTIEADSIQCKDKWLSEKDLRKVTETAVGPKVLDVEHFEEIRFVSKRVATAGGGQFEVEGLLWIRELARPVTLKVRLQREGDRLRLVGSGELRLSDYKIRPPSMLLGVVGTRDDMKVLFDVVAER